jgi:hypothetical protein
MTHSCFPLWMRRICLTSMPSFSWSDSLIWRICKHERQGGGGGGEGWYAARPRKGNAVGKDTVGLHRACNGGVAKDSGTTIHITHIHSVVRTVA